MINKSISEVREFGEFLDTYEHVPVQVFQNPLNGRKPLVSVCVQTYQHKDFIRECLDGILKQRTTFEFEVLISEDASSDGTREICQQYFRDYPERVRLFLHHRANNIAIGDQPTGRFGVLYNFFKARGEYIAFCEGDDYWLDPMKLESQVAIVQAGHFNAVFSNAQVVDETGNVIRLFKRNRLSGVIPKREVFLEAGGLFPTASLLFRRSEVPSKVLLKHIDFPGGDTLIIYLLARTGDVYYDNSVLVCYRIWEGGIQSSIRSSPKELVKIKILEIQEIGKILPYFENRAFRKFLRRRISLNALYILRKTSSLNTKRFALKRLMLVDFAKYLTRL